jgi:serine O-acetyltransferase
MANDSNECIKADMYRYFGETRIPLKKRLMVSLAVRYLIVFRKAHFSKNVIARHYYQLRLNRLMRMSMIQIPAETKIGKGFYIGHFGRIIIHPRVVMGENINIATGVTIGKSNRGMKRGTPTIGNNVWIGTNAVIVGDIVIGEDVLIAPNSYVNFDVPSHSIVIGNPAKIHFRANATEGYINRPFIK